MSEIHIKSRPKPHLVIKYPALPVLIALVIMVIFDQITWERQFGLQFLLLVLFLLVGLFTMVGFERKHIPWASYLLLVPILFGAGMTVIQKADSTTFFNILLALSGLVLLALTLLNGQWIRYRIREVLMGVLLLIQSALIDPVRVLIERVKSRDPLPAKQKNPAWRRVKPYLLGLLIALPLLLILGALLASADLIFRQSLSNLFNWFKIENLYEFIFRATYILIFAYALAGVLIHALTHSADKKALTPDEPFFKPFLGHVEALTVLALINLLFLGFILIQFRYFFAGEANISLEGFTYAEYARRGFFELVAVAIISLGLYYILSMVTKRTERKKKRIFSALGLLLMMQVGTMLFSAFQRLSLYEAAYGFTTLRTITHVFMVWLGVLLGAVAVMEIFNQFRRLSIALILVFFGFTLTLNLLNVDRFIARRNIEHAIAGYPLDAQYLVWNLSDDGIPILFDYEQAEDTPDDISVELQAVLACRYAQRKKAESRDFWAEWHLAVSRADVRFAQHGKALEAYPFIEKSEPLYDWEADQQMIDAHKSYFISVDGEEVWCLTEQGD